MKIRTANNLDIRLVEAYIAGKLYSGFRNDFGKESVLPEYNLENLLIGVAYLNIKNYLK